MSTLRASLVLLATSVFIACASQQPARTDSPQSRSAPGEPPVAASELVGVWDLVPDGESEPETLHLREDGGLLIDPSLKVRGRWTYQAETLQLSVEHQGREITIERQARIDEKGRLFLSDSDGGWTAYRGVRAVTSTWSMLDGGERLRAGSLSLGVPPEWQTRVEPPANSGHQRVALVSADARKQIMIVRFSEQDADRFRADPQAPVMSLFSKLLSELDGAAFGEARFLGPQTKYGVDATAVAVAGPGEMPFTATLMWVDRQPGFAGCIFVVMEADRTETIPAVLASMTVETEAR